MPLAQAERLVEYDGHPGLKNRRRPATSALSASSAMPAPHVGLRLCARPARLARGPRRDSCGSAALIDAFHLSPPRIDKHASSVGALVLRDSALRALSDSSGAADSRPFSRRTRDART